jgi:hypothetical protein
MRQLYKLNKIFEIVLFGLSVFVVTFLSNEKLYWWLALASLIIIILEIVLKNKEYNFILRQAKLREYKIAGQELNGITNHYFMRDATSKKSGMRR